LRTVFLCGIVLPKGDAMGEEKGEIQVRAMNGADWQDLYAMGNTCTPT
jgi:hypothetical protein